MSHLVLYFQIELQVLRKYSQDLEAENQKPQPVHVETRLTETRIMISND